MKRVLYFLGALCGLGIGVHALAITDTVAPSFEEMFGPCMRRAHLAYELTNLVRACSVLLPAALLVIGTAVYVSCTNYKINVRLRFASMVKVFFGACGFFFLFLLPDLAAEPELYSYNKVVHDLIFTGALGHTFDRYHAMNSYLLVLFGLFSIVCVFLIRYFLGKVTTVPVSYVHVVVIVLVVACSWVLLSNNARDVFDMRPLVHRVGCM